LFNPYCSGGSAKAGDTVVVISTIMSAVAARTLMRRINELHLLSLALIMATKRKGVKGEEELPSTLQGGRLYAPSCREAVFFGNSAVR
jgi:hypothetical protein